MNLQSSTPAVVRAYSVIDIKAIDEEKRELTGIASTPTPDRYDDIVEPKGAEYKLPLPLLWQHMSSMPVGNVTKAKVTNDGIEVLMKLAKIDEPGTLKNRLDEAWQSVKAGLVRGLSIGFTAIEYSRIADTGGLRFLKWEWLELSLVTIPANADATITAFKGFDYSKEGDRKNGAALIKRLDIEQRAASGPIYRGPVTLISRRDGRTSDGAIKLIKSR